MDQVVSFQLDVVSIVGNLAFETPPRVNFVNGALTFTAMPNTNGTALVAVQLVDDGGTERGGVDRTPPVTLTINVTAVNDAPFFTPGVSPTVWEDAGLVTIAGWATGIARGPDTATDELVQVLTFLVNIVGTTGELRFATPPTIDPLSGDLSFQTLPDSNGTATITVQLTDDGGTANGGIDVSAVFTRTITVESVNDPPSFQPGADPRVAEDAGPISITGWATNIVPGPVTAIDEVVQSLNFQVTVLSTTGNLAFSSLPAVSAATGTLTFQTAPHTNGTAILTVELLDNGGTERGGVDRSGPVTLTLTVDPVNDAPVFTPGPHQTVLEDAGLVVAPNWATAIANGPPAATDEVNQVRTFVVDVIQTTGNLAFTTLPAVSPNEGHLTFQAATDTNGVAVVTVQLIDDGGIALGGVDRSPVHTLTITVQSVNDAPQFTAGPHQFIDEDAGLIVVPGWATDMAPGPATATDEATQTLTFVVNIVSTTDGLTFTTAPTVNIATGALSFQAAPDSNGQAVVAVELRDNGGTARGGVDSFTHTLTISVAAVNDPPVLTLPSGTLAYVEDQPPAPLDPAATVTDIDSPVFEGGSLTVSVVFNAEAADRLSVEAVGSVTRQDNLVLVNGAIVGTVTGGAAGAPLVINFTTPAATVAAVQAVARAVSFSNNVGQSAAARTIRFELVDGDGGNDRTAAVMNVNLTPVNDPPFARDVTITAQEDGPPVNGAFDGDDVDPDDDPTTLAYTIISQPTEGAVVNNGNGTFTFSPGGDFQDLGVGETRVATFQYVATDSHGVQSNPATVRVFVEGTNDVPVAAEDRFAAARNLLLVVGAPGVLANDRDIDGDLLTAELVSGPASGQLDLRADGSFTYTPVADFLGNVTFTYKANDGRADSNVVTVTLTYTIPPVANDDVVLTVQDRITTIPVLLNDFDPDGSLNPGSILIVSPPINGTAVINSNGTITYTPTPGFLGGDGFSYTVADNVGVRSNVATVSIQINVPHPWMNPVQNQDVNGDGFVTAMDALLIINRLNTSGSERLPNPPTAGFAPPPYYDTNGDEFITPADALVIINRLNNPQVGEGEAIGVTTLDAFAPGPFWAPTSRLVSESQRASGELAAPDGSRAASGNDASVVQEELAAVLAEDAAFWTAGELDASSALDEVLEDLVLARDGSRNAADDVDQILGDDLFRL